MNFEKAAASVFYLPENDKFQFENGIQYLNMLLPEANPDYREDAFKLIICKWAGLYSEASLLKLKEYRVLQFSFFRSDIYEIINQPPVDGDIESIVKDSGYRIIQKFKRNCEILEPDIAFIATHLGQADPDRTLAHEYHILNNDFDSLIHKNYSLLFIREACNEYRDWNPYENRKDSLYAEEGMYIFRGKGAGSRW